MAISTRGLLAALLLLSVVSGCGRVTSTSPVIPTASVSPTPAPPSEPTTGGTAQLQGGLTPVTGLAPAPGNTSACLGLNTCKDTTGLALGAVKKTKKGFLWRKLQVTGSVINPGTKPLSGEIQIHFMHKGQVVESQFKPFIGVGNGQPQNFDVMSNEAADNVDITITTDGDPFTPASGPAIIDPGTGQANN